MHYFELHLLYQASNKQAFDTQIATFSAHSLTTLVSSVTTISVHFNDGSFNFFICFFTIVSKAMSGVNRPVLWHLRLVST